MLIIGILVPNVTDEAPGGPVPPLEVLSCERHQAVGNLWGDNLNVLFGDIPYASILDSGWLMLAMITLLCTIGRLLHTVRDRNSDACLVKVCALPFGPSKARQLHILHPNP